jgi:hypothetical protein
MPAVAAVTEGGLTGAGTSLPVTLPASGSATDVYIVIIAKGSVVATINTLTDWGEVLDESTAAGLAVLHYTGTGVPGDPTFTQSASSRSVWGAYRITGADRTIAPQVGTTASGTSTTPDPPSVTVTGGPKDVLAIACFAAAGELADTDTLVTTFPTNYTDGQIEKTGGISGSNLAGLLGSAARQAAGASAENPGTFTQNASRAWRAQTVIVHPAPTATTVAAVSLESQPTPDTQTFHAIKARARKTAGAGTVTFSAALYEGATNRSGDLTTAALTASLADYSLAIPDANAANITDYSNLELRFWGNSSTGDMVSVEVANLYLQTPEGTGAVTNNLAGTIASASTVTGTLTVTGALAGTVASASTVTGTLTNTAPGIALAGTIASASTVTGHVTVTKPLAGTVASTSTATGAVVVQRPLAGTIASASIVTGAAASLRALAATVASTSTVTGQVTVTKLLAGTIASASTVTGAPTYTRPLAGTVASDSTVTGTLTNTAPGGVALAGTVTATSTVEGAITVERPLAGTITSTSTATGAVTVTRPLAGTVASASTVTGTLTVEAAGANVLRGTIASTSTVTGHATVTKPLAGTVASTSTVTGAAGSLRPLAGTVTSSSTITGAAGVRAILAGQVASTSTLTGHVLVYRDLAGTVTATSLLTATLTNQGPVTAVGQLEAGLTAVFTEGHGTAVTAESGSTITISE